MSVDTTSLKPFNDWPNDKGFEVSHEERTPIEVTVTGKIPAYAAGTLYRTGPGGYKVDTAKATSLSMSHWFDGFTQVHRFQIIPSADSTSPTRVLYNSRHTCDPLIEKMKKDGSHSQGFSFGQKRDPCQSFFGKVQSVFTPQEYDANIGVTLSVNFPGLPSAGGEKASGIQSLWAKTDANALQRLDPETLEPIGFARQGVLHPELKGPLSGAHSKSDPVTGDVFNYNLAPGATTTYRVFHASASTGKTKIIATITDAPGAYLHSIALTENYVILCVWAGHYAWGGAKLIWEKNMLDSMMPLDPSKPTQWYVVDRKNDKGVVAKFNGSPFFCFHTINAWEEPSTSDPSKVDVVVDLSAYENLDILKKFYYKNLLSSSPGAREYTGDKGASTRANLNRWRLPSVNKSSSSFGKAVLDFSVPKAESCELPTMNPHFITKPSRYIYGAIDRGKSTFMDALVKYDTQTRTAVFWEKHGHNPGEAIFIPNPDGTEEDDGVLLSVVLDGFEGKSYLLVLDAKTVTELGRASLECAVGFGFHGTHTSKGGSAVDY